MSCQRSLAIGVVIALSLAALWRCRQSPPPTTQGSLAGATEEEPTQPGSEAGSVGAPASPPQASSTPAPAQAESPEPGASPEPAAEPLPSASGGTVARVLGKVDKVDLDLYARIERETGRDIPRSVHTIVARRHAGASRAELTEDIKRSVDDPRLRLFMVSWLDQAFGTSASEPAPPGAGSGPSLVRPLKK